MKNTKMMLIVGAVLAAVVAFWMVTRGGDQESPAAKKAGDEKPVVAQPDKESKPAVKTGSATGAQQAQVLFDDDPMGGLRLEGQVIDSNQEPVAGAIVSIDARPPKITKTSDDGSFFFESLVGKSYDVVARSPDGVAGPVTVRLSESSEPVILSLVPGSKVHVTVVSEQDPEGISDVSLELRGLDVQSTATDSAGQATFTQVPVGGYHVVAKAEGYAPVRAFVSVSRSGATVDTRLELKPGAAVHGSVVDTDGKAVPGARVIYGGASNWGVRASARLDGVLSDDSGNFSFPALPGGSFRFTATAEGFASGSSALVSLNAQEETTGVVVVMEPEATLRGMVLSKEGEPIAAARVRVAVKTARRMGPQGRTRQAFSDDKGHYELSGLSRSEYEVLAIHALGSSAIEVVDLSKAPYSGELTLELAIDGVIAGVVVDSAGEPIAGAQVMVSPNFLKTKDQSFSRWRMSGRAPELTDSGGHFRVTGLEKDEFYSVRAFPGGESSRGRAWMTEPVDARSGDEDLRIVLPADGGIKGTVVLENGKSPTSFTVSTGWRRGTPFFSDDGKFELSDLPPQEFTVTIRGPGFEQRQIPNVKIEEGKILDLGSLKVNQGRTVSGRVVDANGSPVQGAVVSAGRVIFGDGSSSVASGGSRNPLARDTKTTTSGENGGFEIFGTTLGDLSVVADHETIGRSLPVKVQLSNESIVGLELVLQKTGALEGVVRKSGVPEAGVILIASSTRVEGVTFNVATGQDGKYRFDRLVPDEYRVKGMVGGNPMAGMSFFAKLVDVVPEQVTTLDLDIDEGGAVLKVSLQAETKLGFSMLSIVPGKHEATSARELSDTVGQGAGFEGSGMSIRGRPAVVKNLKPGGYTICAIVYPVEVTGMAGTMDYIRREGDNLPAQCSSVQITSEPEQAVTLKVVIPAYVPPPDQKEVPKKPAPTVEK